MSHRTTKLRIQWTRSPGSIGERLGHWLGYVGEVHVGDIEGGRGQFTASVQTRLGGYSQVVRHVLKSKLGSLAAAKLEVLAFWEAPTYRAELLERAAFLKRLRLERPDLFAGELENPERGQRQGQGVFAEGQRLALSFGANPWNVPGMLRVAVGVFEADAGELDSAHQDESAGRPWRVIAKELDSAADRIEKKNGK